MHNIRAVEVVRVLKSKQWEVFFFLNLKYVSSKNRSYKMTEEIIRRKIVIKFQLDLRLKCLK